MGGGGGGTGVLPRKILKTKKAGEAISGHLRTNLPSVNEHCMLFFRYKI